MASFLEHISSIVEQHEAHVVDMKVGTGRKRSTLEVFVDNEQGVDADGLARISAALADFLEKQDIFDTAYDLVVSSPGLDRPLLYAWQYKRHVGAQCDVLVREAEGKVHISGTLIEADDEGISIRILKTDRRIPMDSIVEGRIVPSLKKRQTSALDTSGD